MNDWAKGEGQPYTKGLLEAPPNPKLPIGLQLLGKAFDEETILRVVHAYEQATEWKDRHPSMQFTG